MTSRFARFGRCLVARRTCRFQWRYLRGDTPWDTGVTPPEVVAFMARTPPGRALDLGCGTGTNAVALALRGWRVTGVDFAPRAVAMARRKAAAAGVDVAFHTADVTDLGFLSGGFDYALDIGCLFTLAPADRRPYAEGLGRLVAGSGRYMLYQAVDKQASGRKARRSPMGKTQQPPCVVRLLPRAATPHFGLRRS